MEKGIGSSKVVTGLRRCRKSTLLQMFQERLRCDGISPDQILSINFEDMAFEDLLDYKALYQYILERLAPDKMNYIFLDEIQLVPNFQKAVDSLYIKENVDLYITGSNAFLLSGELDPTFRAVCGDPNAAALLPGILCPERRGKPGGLIADYLRYGGLPYLAALNDPAEKADVYLEGIYNTIIVKDIELRQQHREEDPNKRKITDLTLLKNISRFLANSVGSPVSIKRIADYITSSGRKISQSTVSDYVEALIEPYVFYPAERYDVVGKQLLKQNQKLYIVDLGLRRHLVPRQNYDLGFSLENVVYLELLRRDFQVNVGKVGKAEVDFVARKGDMVHYYQVTASLTDESTFTRGDFPSGIHRG